MSEYSIAINLFEPCDNRRGQMAGIAEIGLPDDRLLKGDLLKSSNRVRKVLLELQDELFIFESHLEEALDRDWGRV